MPCSENAVLTEATCKAALTILSPNPDNADNDVADGGGSYLNGCFRRNKYGLSEPICKSTKGKSTTLAHK